MVDTLIGNRPPDVILAEPVGSCTDLVATVVRPLGEIYGLGFRMGPYAVVVDATTWLMEGKKKRSEGKFSADVDYIYRKQLEEADWLVVNKVDLLTARQRAHVSSVLTALFPGKRLFFVSVATHEGLDGLFTEMLRALPTGESGGHSRTSLEVDYERYASGDFPNQHAGGDGLPKYIAGNRSIENEDIVVWHSFGHTHVCKPEDFPIMPVEYAGFTLKPNGFFAENPAMDLPADANAASTNARTGKTCCD